MLLNIANVYKISETKTQFWHPDPYGLEFWADISPAISRATNLKGMLKSLELALSSELGALRVSWEVYMKKVTIKSEMEMDGRSSRHRKREG